MIIADVLTDETAVVYRAAFRQVTFVRLLVTVEAALARARHCALTETEMRLLHVEQAQFSTVDVEFDTQALGVEDVTESVSSLLH